MNLTDLMTLAAALTAKIGALVPDSIFLAIAAATITGALITVLSRSLIYALMGLVLTMFGIAGLYVYLDSPFLAMMQILIYVGAITILLAFAIMLAGPMYRHPGEWPGIMKFAGALIVSILPFIFLYKVLMRTDWLGGGVDEFGPTTKEIGRALFDKLTFPFELISLLIVVAIIGAIMLALLSKGEK
jgi:NADH:ubiquinone oxidoreductase subunit 6 (subunit J)